MARSWHEKNKPRRHIHSSAYTVSIIIISFTGTFQVNVFLAYFFQFIDRQTNRPIENFVNPISYLLEIMTTTRRNFHCQRDVIAISSIEDNYGSSQPIFSKMTLDRISTLVFSLLITGSAIEQCTTYFNRALQH